MSFPFMFFFATKAEPIENCFTRKLNNKRTQNLKSLVAIRRSNAFLENVSREFRINLKLKNQISSDLLQSSWWYFNLLSLSLSKFFRSDCRDASMNECEVVFKTFRISTTLFFLEILEIEQRKTILLSSSKILFSSESFS